jgi:hypothetical protein
MKPQRCRSRHRDQRPAAVGQGVEPPRRRRVRRRKATMHVPLALDRPMPSTLRTEACGQALEIASAAAGERPSTRAQHLPVRPTSSARIAVK